MDTYAKVFTKENAAAFSEGLAKSSLLGMEYLIFCFETYPGFHASKYTTEEGTELMMLVMPNGDLIMNTFWSPVDADRILQKYADKDERYTAWCLHKRAHQEKEGVTC